MDRIDIIYKWYCDAMMDIAGRHIKWPDAKDYRHTYLYMWLSKFESWVVKNEISDNIACKVMHSLIKYGKKHGILYKGAAILQHEKIYEIALKEIELQMTKSDSEIQKIQSVDNYLTEQATAIKKNKIDYLLHFNGIGQLPNIVLLYQNNMLPIIYLAVSKSCRLAISKLKPNVRAFLPQNTELFKTQQITLLNKEKMRAIMVILKNDVVSI